MPTPTITLTFEEGTDGTSIVAGGNYAAVVGANTYSTAAAKHGSLGVTASTGTSSGPTFAVTKSASFVDSAGSFAVSLYVNPQSISGGAIQLCQFQTSASSILGQVRAHSDGHFDIAGSTTRIAATTLSWSAGTWYRLDIVATWGATPSVTVNVFAGTNVEGTTADETITGTVTAGTVAKWVCSAARSTTAGCSAYVDTIRFYDGAVTPAPYATSAYSGSGSLTGSGTLSAAGTPLVVAGATLGGSGAVVTPSTPGFVSAPVTLGGTGTLLNGANFATLSGSGALSGAAVSADPGNVAPIAGSGTLTASGSSVGLNSLALSGSGSLSGHGGALATVTLTFEEGTDGASIAAGGNYAAVTATAPTYSTAAAKHGNLGMTASTGTSTSPTITVNRTGAFTDANKNHVLSLYVNPQAVPGGAIQHVIFQNASSQILGQVRCHSDGHFDLAGSTTRVAATALSWTAGTWYRLDVTYTGSTNAASVAVFAGPNVEGTTPDETISGTLTTQTGGVDHWLFSPARSTAANCSSYVDTIRIFDGTVTPSPYAAPTTVVPLSGAGSLSAAGGSGTGLATLSGSGSLAVASGALTVVHNWVGAPVADGFRVISRTTGFTAPTLVVSGNSDMSAPVGSFTGSAPDANGYVTFASSGLAAGSWYYQVNELRSGSLIPVGGIGRARTLPASGTHRIAFGSCVTTNATDATALNDVVAWDPDLFVFLGDFDYSGDQSTDPNHQRATWESQIAGAAGMSSLLAKVPWAYATSDHEAGPDNGDSNNAYTAANITAYKQIVPTYPLGDTRATTVGRYQTWTIGRVRYILLDIRNTDRSPGANVDDSTKTMLGAVQKQWLKDQLVKSEPVKVILSDVAWMGAATTTNGPDKWWSYSTERTEIANYIAANGVKVLFWHGDTHSLAVATPAKNTYGGFPIYCSSPMRNSGGGLNLSTFSSYWNNAGGSCASYGRVTVTDTGSAITFTYSGWDATAGVERVAQTDTFSTANTTSLSGSGTLSATSGPVVTGSGGLSAIGVLAGSGTPASANTPALSGAGALLASTAFAVQATSSLSGAGTVLTTPTPRVATAPALTGGGSLTGGGVSTLFGTPTLTGSGALATSATARVTASLALAGSGALGVGFLAGVAGAATLSGSGALSFGTALTLLAGSTLTGAGILTSTGTPAVSGLGVPLSGSGTLAATPSSLLTGTAALAGGGVLGGIGSATLTAAIALAGSGALGSAATQWQQGLGVLTGSGALAGAFGPGIASVASFTALGALATSSTTQVLQAALFGAQGTLGVAVVQGGSGSALLGAAGSLTVGYLPGALGVAALTGNSSLAVSAPAVSRSIVASLSGSGGVLVTPLGAPIVAASLSGAGAMLASGSYGFTPAPPLTGLGALSSTALVGPSATVALAGQGSLGTLTTLAIAIGLGYVPLGTSPLGIGADAPSSVTGSGALTTAPVTPTPVVTTVFGGLGALGGTQSGEVATGAGALVGLGMLTPARLAGLVGAANLAASGQLAQLAGVMDGGIASTFMVGTLSIPSAHGAIVGADHPLWIEGPTVSPTPWVRHATPDLIAALSPDPLRAQRSPARAY